MADLAAFPFLAPHSLRRPPVGGLLVVAGLVPNPMSRGGRGGGRVGGWGGGWKGGSEGGGRPLPWDGSRPSPVHLALCTFVQDLYILWLR